MTLSVYDRTETKVLGTKLIQSIGKRLRVFEPLAEAELPKDIPPQPWSPRFAPFFGLLTRDFVDWIKTPESGPALAGAFMSPERKEVARFYFHKVWGMTLDERTEYVWSGEGLDRLGVLHAPRGHGKTHFVKVLGAALAITFPNAVVAYIQAVPMESAVEELIKRVAIAKRRPDLVERRVSLYGGRLPRSSRSP
jgi:hypothetical protein